jgi:hypothetical protein
VSVWRKVGIWVAQIIGIWALVMLGAMFFLDAPKGRDYWENLRGAAIPLLIYVSAMRFIAPKIWAILRPPKVQPYRGREETPRKNGK